MTRLLVWRHGKTGWNDQRRFQGQQDVPLDDLGQDQAAEAAKRLAELRPDAIISSDLRRALDTAAALAALTGLPVRADARLRERRYGEWEGHTAAEVRQRWPLQYAGWRAGAGELGIGIESLDDMTKRVVAALTDAADAHAGGTIVAVTHGGSARHGCGALLGWPADTLRTVANFDNCHWADLRHEGERGWQLHAYNVG